MYIDYAILQSSKFVVMGYRKSFKKSYGGRSRGRRGRGRTKTQRSYYVKRGGGRL